MPRSRAYRRHRRRVALARRYRIVREAHRWVGFDYEPDPRNLNWHLNCGCWDLPDMQSHRRRRNEREWRSQWADELLAVSENRAVGGLDA